jgi:hypothetical protein
MLKIILLRHLNPLIFSVRLAESCSHVGAMLYTIENAVRMRETVTCTMEKSKWLMPSYVNKVK